MEIHKWTLTALGALLGKASLTFANVTCAPSSTLFSPTAPTSTLIPQFMGPGLDSPFQNVVHSTLSSDKRSLDPIGTASLYYVVVSDCPPISSSGTLSCYNKSTAESFLPDEGNITIGGEFSSSDGKDQNLEIRNDIQENEIEENRCSDDSRSKLDTITLPIRILVDGISPTSADALSAWVTATYTFTAPKNTDPVMDEPTISHKETKEKYPVLLLLGMKNSTRDPRSLLPYVVFANSRGGSITSGIVRYQLGATGVNGTTIDPNTDSFWSQSSQDAVPTDKKNNGGPRKNGRSLNLAILVMGILVLVFL